MSNTPWPERTVPDASPAASSPATPAPSCGAAAPCPPLLRRSWQWAWREAGAQGDGLAVRDALREAWAEPQRAYHGLQHLEECLAWFEVGRAACEHPAEVALALWFHDAVYQPGRPDNEARSADWARGALQAAGAPDDVAGRVHALVMSTRHDALPEGQDAQVLSDIDLSILGADATRFAQYEAQIGQEYAHVDAGTRRVRRAAILQGFLDRAVIYHTTGFHSRLESRARANLAASVAALAGDAGGLAPAAAATVDSRAPSGLPARQGGLPWALDRVVVVGMSGSGKSTLAGELCALNGAAHVELDALFWGPDWQPRPQAAFLASVESAVAGERWVVDGNYSSARSRTWRHAQTVIWLNLPFGLTLWRVFWRTLARAVTRRALWQGNRETLRRAFLSRESLLVWVWTMHGPRQREMAALRASGEYPHLTWVELRNPSQVDGFLSSVRAAAARASGSPAGTA